MCQMMHIQCMQTHNLCCNSSKMNTIHTHIHTNQQSKTIIDMCAGSQHTCAALKDGTVKCWGANNRGQLGYGSSKIYGTSASDMGDNLPTVNLGTVSSHGLNLIFSCASLLQMMYEFYVTGFIDIVRRCNFANWVLQIGRQQSSRMAHFVTIIIHTSTGKDSYSSGMWCRIHVRTSWQWQSQMLGLR